MSGQEKACDTASPYDSQEQPEGPCFRKAAREPAAEQHHEDTGEGKQGAYSKKDNGQGVRAALLAMMRLLHRNTPFKRI
jgi:hypothetical protein